MKKTPYFSFLSVPIFVAAALVMSGCAHPQGRTAATEVTVTSLTSTTPTKAVSGKRKSFAAKETTAKAEQGKITVGKSFRVRTTAYTGTKNAIGGRLSHGSVTSAASDWSRFPLGTRFRIRETGRVYEIDDYGSALVGTHTIDLAKTGKQGVNAWGVRWVNIDIIKWGSPRRSLEVLTPRVNYRHIRPMVTDLRGQTEGVPSQFHRIGL